MSSEKMPSGIKRIEFRQIFYEFFENERSSGFILIFVTVLSLLLANSSFGQNYTSFYTNKVGHYTILEWINDGLMAIFFLLVGLELQKEFYRGTLSTFKNASLPVIGAFGGMVVPACIYALINFGKPSISGAGIPMATDIAFAVGILSLLGKSVPFSLKVFLTALAVVDDLGAIIVIALFYSSSLVWINLLISLGIFALLLVCSRILKWNVVWIYIAGGILMWYFMHHSGIHATIAGVLMAFTIPMEGDADQSLSYKMQHFLHKPVSFFIMPVFALANTALSLKGNFTFLDEFTHSNSMGIIAGLVIGKPLGITLFSLIGVLLGVCSKPKGVKWIHIAGVGMLGGIGFTMSIFVTLLSFKDPYLILISKIAILFASTLSGLFGYLFLKITLRKRTPENDLVSNEKEV